MIRRAIRAQKNRTARRRLICEKLEDRRLLAVLNPGDILAVDYTLDAVLKIDPTTGNRTVVSAGANASGGATQQGTGGSFGAPQDVVIEDSGNLIVTDRSFDPGTGSDEYVVRVDPATGNRTILSGPMIGTGPVLLQQTGLARAADGTIYVGDANLEAVISIDPLTGNRTVFSGGTNVGGGGSARGTGGNFEVITSIAVASKGDLIVADRDYDANADTTNDGEHVVRVDAATGNRTIVSGPTTGTGVTLDQQAGVAIGSDGTVYVGDQNRDVVFSVDPANGNRTIYSAGTNASGGASSIPGDRRNLRIHSGPQL